MSPELPGCSLWAMVLHSNSLNHVSLDTIFSLGSKTFSLNIFGIVFCVKFLLPEISTADNNNNDDAEYIVCLPSATMCSLSNTVVFISALLHTFFIQRSFIVSNLGPADVLQGKVEVTVLHPQTAPG